MENMAVLSTKERNTFSVGLLVAFSSWALIFFTLLWGYVVYRVRSTTWLGEIITSEIFYLSLMNSALLIVSSKMLSLGVVQKIKSSSQFLWIAFSLGVIFLLGQVRLWSVVLTHGLHWKESLAGSFLFLLTGFHAAHIVGGLVAILILALKYSSLMNSFFAQGTKHFWDLLLVVWLIMFVLIFVVK